VLDDWKCVLAIGLRHSGFSRANEAVKTHFFAHLINY